MSGVFGRESMVAPAHLPPGYAENVKKTADVVVVGGGIIGCSVTRELAMAGVDVMLIERSEIAAGASGRNHGLLFYPQDQRTDDLFRASRAVYEHLEDESTLRLSLDRTPRGFIILVTQESEWAAAEAEAKACAVGGVEVSQMSRDDVLREEPNVTPSVLGGWFIEDGFRLDPAALTLATALSAREAGAEVLTHTDVKQVLLEGDRVTGVATDNGIVSSPTVVDAAGPWAPKLARTVGADLPITGARGWLLLTRAVPPLTNHLLESSGWHLTAGDPGPKAVTVQGYGRGEHPADPDIGMLIQQNATGHVLLGGSRLASTREDPEGHEVTREIATRAAAALPALADVEVIAVWSGVRPMSRDGLPFIGAVDGIEGFFVVGGHGGQGVMLGAGSARLAAEMLTGETTFTDPAAFAPCRGS